MRSFILFILTLVLASCGGEETTPQQRPPIDGPPNIVLIITDDLGIGSIGAYGNNSFHTPHLDYWADNGLKFEQFYVTSPVCSPSRASIFTGQPASVNGVTKVLKPAASGKEQQLNTSLPLFTERIKEKGYRTALIGKWHLGYDAQSHPQNRGFDEFKGFLGGHVDYISHQSSEGQWPLVNVSKSWRGTPDKHLTELLTDEAISFLQSAHSQPYCLVLSYANPHRPILLPEEDAAFPGKADQKLDTPQRYKSLVELLDQEIGRLQETLTQLEDNTVVVFLSDHGAPADFEGNAPFNGGKGTLYEGGIRVPALIYWPQKVKPQSVTTITNALDLYPSLLHLAGNEPVNTPGRIWVDRTGKLLSYPDQVYIWSYGKVKAIRNNNWKAIFIPTRQGGSLNRYLSLPLDTNLLALSQEVDDYIPLLFNLQIDPGEQHNLSTSQREVLTSLWTIIQNDTIGIRL